MEQPRGQTTTPSLSPLGHIVFHTDVPNNGNDPWALFLSPPTNETREEMNERLAGERHAKEVSDEIDEEIEKERELEKKAPKVFRILLLGKSPTVKTMATEKHLSFISGQSESGRWCQNQHLLWLASLTFILSTQASRRR